MDLIYYRTKVPAIDGIEQGHQCITVTEEDFYVRGIVARTNSITLLGEREREIYDVTVIKLTPCGA